MNSGPYCNVCVVRCTKGYTCFDILASISDGGKKQQKNNNLTLYLLTRVHLYRALVDAHLGASEWSVQPCSPLRLKSEKSGLKEHVDIGTVFTDRVNQFLRACDDIKYPWARAWKINFMVICDTVILRNCDTYVHVNPKVLFCLIYEVVKLRVNTANPSLCVLRTWPPPPASLLWKRKIPWQRHHRYGVKAEDMKDTHEDIRYIQRHKT